MENLALDKMKDENRDLSDKLKRSENSIIELKKRVEENSKTIESQKFALESKEKELLSRINEHEADLHKQSDNYKDDLRNMSAMNEADIKKRVEEFKAQLESSAALFEEEKSKLLAKQEEEHKSAIDKLKAGHQTKINWLEKEAREKIAVVVAEKSVLESNVLALKGMIEDQEKNHSKELAEKVKAMNAAIEEKEAKVDLAMAALKSQNIKMDVALTNKAMKGVSARIANMASKDKKACDLYKENLISSAAPDTKEYGLVLINEVLGKNYSILVGNGASTDLDEASMQFLASGAYQNCFFRLQFDINTAYFKKLDTSALCDSVKTMVSGFLKCDVANIDIPECNYKKGYLDLVFKELSSVQHAELKSQKFIDFLKKHTGDKLLEMKLKPFLTHFRLTADQLEDKHSVDYTNHSLFEDQRGDMPYYFPVGWKTIGLKVTGKYDKGDDTWLDDKTKRFPEWAVAFHGLSDPLVTGKITTGGLITSGAGQVYRNRKDMKSDQPCGRGCYLSPHIEVSEAYCHSTSISRGGKTIKMLVAMMCRINPSTVKIPKKPSDIGKHSGDTKWDNDYFIINCTNDVRPYRIMYKEVP